MRDINDINIFDRAMSFEDINDILLTAPRTDISQYIKPDDRDFLDKSRGIRSNASLLTQIGVGFTPPGMAIDVAAAGKYGRDAFRDFSEGEIGEGFKNWLAGLSGLAAIPLLVSCSLATTSKSSQKRLEVYPAYLKGTLYQEKSLPTELEKEIFRAWVMTLPIKSKNYLKLIIRRWTKCCQILLVVVIFAKLLDWTSLDQR